MQLLSKLFGGDDGDDDDINDPEPTPTPMSSSALSALQVPLTAQKVQEEKKSSLQVIDERIQSYKTTVATLAVQHTTADTMAAHERMVVDPDQPVAATTASHTISSSPTVSARQQSDDKAGEDMSFDTAISTTARQPATIKPSKQLLSKLFGGDDDEMVMEIVTVVMVMVKEMVMGW